MMNIFYWSLFVQKVRSTGQYKSEKSEYEKKNEDNIFCSRCTYSRRNENWDLRKKKNWEKTSFFSLKNSLFLK